MHCYKGLDNEIYTILGWDNITRTHLIILHANGRRMILRDVFVKSFLTLLNLPKESIL